jgi:hypothetical protein
MCAAKMGMQNWADKYHGILIRAGLRIPLLTGYVDDGRQGGTTLRRGMMFDTDLGDFVMSDEQLRIDIEEDEPDNVRMKKRCLPAMNSINEDLKFTTEAPEDFPSNRLPTLDFVLWLVDGILLHTYFEKAMKNQYTVMQRSAMGEHQRMAIMSNELVRRLSKIHREVVKDELEGVIEK